MTVPKPLPLRRDLTIYAGQTKELLSEVFSSWTVTAVEMMIRPTLDADPIHTFTSNAGGGFTISSKAGYAGSWIVLDIDNSISSTLEPGDYLYDIFITVTGEPEPWFEGVFTVIKPVTR